MADNFPKLLNFSDRGIDWKIGANQLGQLRWREFLSATFGEHFLQWAFIDPNKVKKPLGVLALRLFFWIY